MTESAVEEAEFLPARMINEFVYCPRLFWLEYVEREFAESFDTVDGERVHRRVDQQRGALPESTTDFDVKSSATSVELTSISLGVVAKLDLVQAEDGHVVPIDYERGKAPELGPYDPERVQVCLQALLLREAGYQCKVARIYYAGSKTHVEVLIEADLVSRTLEAVASAKRMLQKTTMPPPLVDSPKCVRCSLHSICLPDETNSLNGAIAAAAIRPFNAPMENRVPLYVLEPGARVGMSGETIQVKTDAGVVADMPLLDLASISLFGSAHISSPAMRAVMSRNLPVFYLSYGGWLSGYARSVDDHSLDLRMAQHALAHDLDARLKIARAMIFGKVKNQRTMIRRSLKQDEGILLRSLALLLHKIERAKSAQELLGYEGNAAQKYFEAFGEMLGVATGFEINGRNRRPPTDPVNALLSFGYAMLTKEAVAALIAVGFEPGLGIYHTVRAGRPSLALDLIEEFRPLIVDSTVLSLLNTKEMRSQHFDRRGKAIVLTNEGRKIFITAFERRLRSTITHPVFGYSVTYRRALNVQARLLARVIQGDIADYPAFTTR